MMGGDLLSYFGTKAQMEITLPLFAPLCTVPLLNEKEALVLGLVHQMREGGGLEVRRGLFLEILHGSYIWLNRNDVQQSPVKYESPLPDTPNVGHNQYSGGRHRVSSKVIALELFLKVTAQQTH